VEGLTSEVEAIVSLERDWQWIAISLAIESPISTAILVKEAVGKADSLSMVGTGEWVPVCVDLWDSKGFDLIPWYKPEVDVMLPSSTNREDGS
jgi:hypothetical protein